MKDTTGITRNASPMLLFGVLAFFFLSILFLVNIHFLGECFRVSLNPFLVALDLAASDPFVLFCVGIILSALVQSSTAVVSMALALVSLRPLEFKLFIPLILGANIGTTFTALVVSISQIGDDSLYKRGLRIAFSHNLFNLIFVFFFFSLELLTGFLNRLVRLIGSGLVEWRSNLEVHYHDPFDGLAKWLVSHISFDGVLVWLILPLSVVSMYLLIKSFVVLFKHYFSGSQGLLGDRFFKSSGYSFLSGLVSTAVVHSSTATTALLVPIASSQKLEMNKAFHFILGANIGTTLTGLSVSIVMGEASIYIALVHFLFNLLSVLVVLLIRPMSRLIFTLSNIVVDASMEYKWFLAFYIAFVFFVFPLVLIYFG